MPSPYVQDLFGALHDDPRIDLRVLYMEQEAPDTYWGEQALPVYAELLPGRWYGFRGARIHRNPTVCKVLRERQDDLVVVVGYVGWTNQVAMRWLTKNRRHWVFWGEIPGFQQRGVVGSWLRELAQRPLKHTAGVAAVGSRAVAAYRELLGEQAADIPVHNIPYHCRVDSFQEAARSRTPLQQRSTKTIRFLFCGQLIARKGVDLLLEAFLQLLGDGHDATLTFAGEGPLKGEFESQVSSQYQSRIRFAGFYPVHELPQVFADHDVFLLPSRHDGWGVVVNQALAAGMPIVVSTAVGAGHDLVVDNENGFRIETDSVSALRRAMETFLRSPDLIDSFGERSRELAETITLEAAVEQWCHFFETCLKRQSPVGVEP